MQRAAAEIRYSRHKALVDIAGRMEKNMTVYSSTLRADLINRMPLKTIHLLLVDTLTLAVAGTFADYYYKTE